MTDGLKQRDRRSSAKVSSAAAPFGRLRMETCRKAITSRTVSRPKAVSKTSRVLDISGGPDFLSAQKLVAVAPNAFHWKKGRAMAWSDRILHGSNFIEIVGEDFQSLKGATEIQKYLPFG
jgi:hypothetical protein